METHFISWREEPNSRGTFRIISTCLTTLSICVWSAVHIDIPKGKKWSSLFLSKLGWLILGLLAPELLLYLAYNQLSNALQLTRVAQLNLMGPTQEPSFFRRLWIWISHSPQGTTKIVDEAARLPPTRRYPWTITHSFYAAMGGFILQSPEDGDDRSYLPEWQQNGVLTLEGVRYLMQADPSLIPDISEADILDKSKADLLAKALLMAQVLWFCLNSFNRLTSGLSLTLLEISTLAHALCTIVTYGIWWSKPLNINEPTVITGAGAREIGAWMSMSSKAQRYILGGIMSMRHSSEYDHVVLTNFDPASDSPDILFRYEHGQSKETPPGAVLPLGKFLANIRTNYVFHLKPLPWYMKADADPSNDKHCQLRWQLASNALRNCKIIPLKPHPEAYYHPFITPVAHLQTSTDTRRYDFWSYLRTSLIATGLGFVYGAPHFIGWTVRMRHARQAIMWRVTSLVVTACAPTLGIFLVLSVVTQRHLIKLGISSNLLDRLVLAFAAIFYVASSSYLTVESFVQLWYLPPDAFDVPEWTKYWPHVS